MKIKNGFKLRTVADTSIVVAVGDVAKKFNAIVNLNESGALLWKKLETGATKEQLVDTLLKEYEISKEIANNDVEKFIERLKEADLLEE